MNRSNPEKPPLRRIAGGTLFLLLAIPLAQAQDSSPLPSREGTEYFEKKIRPVLAERCFSCHSQQAKKLKGGLLLDSREGMQKGGDSGPALIPGDVENSRIVKALRYRDENLQMPPKEPLPAEQVADFEAWVRMGAPDPRRKGAAPPSADPGAARSHWSFRPPGDPPIPPVQDPAWVRNGIDAFVLSRLEARGLKPAPTADRRTLLRRVTYDLVGLPPTPAEQDAFLSDPSPEAYERVIERLLASPRYGERWGRHWLDVARYADTKEWVVDEERRLPFSYTYRDWVIRAFNEDLPYDQFLIQQLAADKMSGPVDPRSLAALGFLTVGRSFLNRQPDIIDDRIDVVCRGLLGLTASCARCHDHKYDPIPTRDYYSLYGVFASAATPKELPLIGAPERTPEYAAYEKEFRAKEGQITSFKMARHATIVAGFRTSQTIADFLMAARDAGSLPDEAQKTLADGRKLNLMILKRWIGSLRKSAEKHDPVFGLWTAYAAIPEAEFPEKAPWVLYEARETNRLVQEAFAEAPSSLREAAERYGTLLASFNRESASRDPEVEALRQAISAPDAAPNMSLQEVDQFLTQDDRGKLRKMRKDLDGVQHLPGAPARAMALEDSPQPLNPKVFVRGNPGTPGDEVPRQFLGCLSGPERVAWKSGGRLELAQAIASSDNPLTARVMVNRIWLHFFGQGIVRTPSDFGTRGEPPTHPELLDWLARRFEKGGWSMKKLHTLILLSSTYRQQSQNPPAEQADPQNLLLGRMNRRRLDFEATRDSLLAVSGRLDLGMGGRSVPLAAEPFTGRRTVYGYVDRLNLANAYRVFDFAGPDMHAPQRYTTTVPQQALFLMNNPFVLEQAQALAARPEILAEEDPEQRVQRLYRAVFGRAATAKEVSLGLRYVLSPQEMRPEASAPAWQYGLGRFDLASGRVEDFRLLPHFTGTAWQGGPKLPDPKLGWSQITARGGHAGEDASRLLVRRWTAPRDGQVTIQGTALHQEKQGDGILARIVSSRAGLLASMVVCRMEAQTQLTGLEVKAGETIDFVVDCRADNTSDAFVWAPVLRMAQPDQVWDAAAQFAGPPEKLPPPLGAWERYAQVLLESNEFAFLE